jgi:hypothetical protein
VIEPVGEVLRHGHSVGADDLADVDGAQERPQRFLRLALVRNPPFFLCRGLP